MAFKKIWYIITAPFKWVWKECKDWKTLLIFGIVMAVVGIEVWLPLLLGLILHNTYLIGIATTCQLFWMLPGTPFLPLCIGITFGIKKIMEKIKCKKK